MNTSPANDAAAPLSPAWETFADQAVETAAAAQREPALAVEHLQKEMAEDAQLVRDFVGESQSHLETAEEKIMALESQPGDKGVLNELFRAFHNLKGLSGFFNLKNVSLISHQAETLLDRARNGHTQIGPAQAGLLLESVDILRKIVSLVNRDLEEGGFEDREYPAVSPLLEKLGRWGEAGAAESKGPAEAPATPAASSPAEAGMSGLKVDTRKLDNLVDLVGELVISQAMVAQMTVGAAHRDPLLSKNVSHLGKIVKDIQYTAMSLRMIPIRHTFHQMERLVRDLSVKFNKPVSLEISGAETELDKNVVEQIKDPLVHLVRNALDHGLEDAALRAERGKPARGRIALRAFHQSGNFVIEIEDDGNGLSPKKIRARAAALGLLPPESSADDLEVLNLIFAPGFSTAQTVTDISGRGVGMDIVKKNIDSLGGAVSIRSAEGKGTTFLIHIPLTLAVMDAMLVGLGAERYLLPVLSIRESVRPRAADVFTVQAKGELLSIRGDLIPLIRLDRALGLPCSNREAWEAQAIIVEVAGRAYGLLVDSLLGQQQVVIKSLKSGIGKLKGVSGCAILGTGRVGLILDVRDIVGNSGAPGEPAARQ